MTSSTVGVMQLGLLHMQLGLLHMQLGALYAEALVGFEDPNSAASDRTWDKQPNPP